MKLDLIVGARPNFVKAAAIQYAAKESFPNIDLRIIHTGQHSGAMSDPFIKELELEVHDLGEFPGGLSTVQRLACSLCDLNHVFKDNRPDWVVVVGDTDATLAGALTAVKMGIPIAHVEAGLRCGDSHMQEEINRRIVDHISTVCYTTTPQAAWNLEAEGHKREDVVCTGNVMVDTLLRSLPRAADSIGPQDVRPLFSSPYALLTLHRAENVDDFEKLRSIFDAVDEVATHIPVIFPMHPRARKHPLYGRHISIAPPMSYLRFIWWMKNAKFVMTDSGGVQEETSALGVPCLTLRESTERPETVTLGTNTIVGINPIAIRNAALSIIHSKSLPRRCQIPKWDGYAAERILQDLVKRG